MAFYELRQYEIRPGCMEAWLDLIENTIIPGQTALGFTVSGSFRGEEDDSVYVWIRRFESEEERVRLYEAYYGTDEWKNVVLPKVQELIFRDRNKITRIVPTPGSDMQ
ncbi:MAG: NIPSNAP family protein [Pseudooceanicola sp.]|nr:NIPSNAP family protein [Pseudooceanicola sp.]